MKTLYKTAEELARLDAIWAEAERKEQAERSPVKEAPRPSSADRLAKLGLSEIVGNAKQMLKDKAFRTKWELVLANTLIKVWEQGDFVEHSELAAMRSELSTLRQVVGSITVRLDKAIKTATEQDNHHYYKVFADQVRRLLNQGEPDGNQTEEA